MYPSRFHNIRVQCEALVINAGTLEEFDDFFFANPLSRLIQRHARVLRYEDTCLTDSSVLKFTIPRTFPPSVLEVSGQSQVDKRRADPFGILRIVKKSQFLRPRVSESIVIRVRERFPLEHLYVKVDVVLLYFDLSVNSKEKIGESVLYKWLPRIKHHLPGTGIILVGQRKRDESIPINAEDKVFQKNDGVQLAKRIGAVAYLEIDSEAPEGKTGVAEVANVLAWTSSAIQQPSGQ